ncbi:hypothetical protein L7F22_061364 [Adiantum nelumboides]|nr:hypothetical protein [Adiantum nelumboides]
MSTFEGNMCYQGLSKKERINSNSVCVFLLQLVIQEESCLRLASFLIDGMVVDHGLVSPTTFVDSMYFSLKQLHVDDFVFVQSLSLKLKSLELNKDPAYFMLWQGQPFDGSQRRWVMHAMHLIVALETTILDATGGVLEFDWPLGIWMCIEMAKPYIEAAMVIGDGEPILRVPPLGGIVASEEHKPVEGVT